MGFAYLLSQLTFDPFDVATWHFFCYSFFGVCYFLYEVVKKTIKIEAFVYVNTWVMIRKHYRKNI
jgi:hypothetical protein